MRPYLLAAGLLAAAMLAPVAGHAANAGNPYGNVNHANDAGNDTGDSQVDRLNDQQLQGNGIPRDAYNPGSVAPGAPPAGYRAPPPGYAPSPSGYAPQSYAPPQGYPQQGYPQPAPPPGYAPPPPPGAYPPPGYGPPPTRY